MDAILRILGEAETEKRPRPFSVYADGIDLAVPLEGISVRSGVRFLRQALGPPLRRITGDVTTHENTIGLRLRIEGPISRQIAVTGSPGESLEAVVDRAAIELLSETDPYILAVYLYDRPERDTALPIILKCAAACPDEDKPWAYNLWGNYLVQNESDYVGAIAKYRFALALDPTFDLAYAGWGDALAANGDCSRAIKKYRRAERTNSVYALLGEAECLSQLGHTKQASRLYRRVMRFDPAHGLAGEAELLGMKGRHGEASRWYERAIRYAPTNHLLYVGWGRALAASQDTDAAIERFKEALSLEPEDDRALVAWGDVLLNRGDLDGASAFYGVALEKNPRSAAALIGVGVQFDRRGRISDAIESFKRALEIDPRDEDAFMAWGSALRCIGDGASADQFDAVAFKINPQAGRQRERFRWLKTCHAQESERR